MQRLAILLGSVAFAGILWGSAALADEGDRTGVNLGELTEPVSATTQVSLFNSAMEMAELGRQNEDPVLLAAAARIVLAVGESPGEDAGETASVTSAKAAEGSADAGSKAADAESPGLVDGLLEDARIFANGNAATLAMIADTEAQAGSSTRANVAGPHSHDIRLKARTARTFKERFVGGQQAEVALRGDGDTDVDLFVYDANGNEVCRSARRRDLEYCSWTPAWTGEFTVRVANLGRVWNQVKVLAD